MAWGKCKAYFEQMYINCRFSGPKSTLPNLAEWALGYRLVQPKTAALFVRHSDAMRADVLGGRRQAKKQINLVRLGKILKCRIFPFVFDLM
jgi:hypothetical protein